MHNVSELAIGAVVNQLTIVEFTRRPKARFPNGAPAARCRCSCGAETVVHLTLLRSGRAKSCGCRKRNRLADEVRSHGRSNSKLTGYADRAYGIWQAMRDRCTNSNRKDWKHYGGKGVEVCARWLKFENFLADMGDPPPGLTIHRLDNAVGYQPDNCVWADRKTQAQETTRTRYVEVGGVRRAAIQVARENGITPGKFRYRLYAKGCSIEEACGVATRR